MPQPKPDLRKYDGEIITHVFTVGSYVLGTKYDDGDPGDAWGVGYYLESFAIPGREGVRHRVIDNDGNYLYGPKGFVKIRPGLRADVGAWLVQNLRALEYSPPGSVNLWTMLTDIAFGVEECASTGGAVGKPETDL